jgi:nucleotide-binding universal stress UspA family protein
MAVVVVGVDGSAQSLEALKLAAREAAWRSGALRAVYVYEPVRPRQADAAAAVAAAALWPSAATSSGGVIAEANRLDDEERAHARRHAEDLLRQIVASVEDDMPDVAIDRVAIGDRHPSEALLRAAADADLLVVGSRGLGGFAGLLLGSIGQQCVQHATCPVLVVRPGPAA